MIAGGVHASKPRAALSPHLDAGRCVAAARGARAGEGCGGVSLDVGGTAMNARFTAHQRAGDLRDAAAHRQ